MNQFFKSCSLYCARYTHIVSIDHSVNSMLDVTERFWKVTECMPFSNQSVRCTFHLQISFMYLPVTYQLPFSHLSVTYQLPFSKPSLTFQLPITFFLVTFQLLVSYLSVSFQSSVSYLPATFHWTEWQSFILCHKREIECRASFKEAGRMN